MVEAPLRLWTRSEYYRLAEVGLIGPDERVELIDGQIVKKVSPQRSPHATAVRLAEEALRNVPGCDARAQLPIVLGEKSEPEPDLAVVLGSARDYAFAHPTGRQIVLVVEIADSTLLYDRRVKAVLYGRFGIQDYWIVDINAGQLIVHREPNPSGYGVIEAFARGAGVTLLHDPSFVVLVDDLLPASASLSSSPKALAMLPPSAHVGCPLLPTYGRARLAPEQ